MIKKKPWVGVVKKLEASDKLVFNKKSNEMDFKSFGAVDGSLDGALASLEKRKLEQVQESLEEGKRLISVKMKEILLEDKHGWDFVNDCSARNTSGGFHNTQSGMFRQLQAYLWKCFRCHAFTEPRR